MYCFFFHIVPFYFVFQVKKNTPPCPVSNQSDRSHLIMYVCTVLLIFFFFLLEIPSWRCLGGGRSADFEPDDFFTLHRPSDGRFASSLLFVPGDGVILAVCALGFREADLTYMVR
ncbi:hypothetical protein C8Q69DRAFT_333434 [Paecilomyces variotii]|uniref:Uncharacterized protein n=1 Tax=Byssochlamys spectabilis TaxID=264951 RepID=A0A443HPH2_BYSSP|nr:hypothetical protein C8Q69DRAFT_333434 [Paecilomyces variotii]RWQ93723.1 hypothetical protein C8Q69DRAFT_333434 [Paecilomyces variotii]